MQMVDPEYTKELIGMPRGPCPVIAHVYNHIFEGVWLPLCFHYDAKLKIAYADYFLLIISSLFYTLNSTPLHWLSHFWSPTVAIKVFKPVWKGKSKIKDQNQLEKYFGGN